MALGTGRGSERICHNGRKAEHLNNGHEVTFKKEQSHVWHPGTGRWRDIRRVRGTYEMNLISRSVCDAFRIPTMTGTRPPSNACPAGTGV